jgi:hypothetical protein
MKHIDPADGFGYGFLFDMEMKYSPEPDKVTHRHDKKYTSKAQFG